MQMQATSSLHGTFWKVSLWRHLKCSNVIGQSNYLQPILGVSLAGMRKSFVLILPNIGPWNKLRTLFSRTYEGRSNRFSNNRAFPFFCFLTLFIKIHFSMFFFFKSRKPAMVWSKSAHGRGMESMSIWLHYFFASLFWKKLSQCKVDYDLKPVLDPLHHSLLLSHTAGLIPVFIDSIIKLLRRRTFGQKDWNKCRELM